MLDPVSRNDPTRKGDVGVGFTPIPIEDHELAFRTAQMSYFRTAPRSWGCSPTSSIIPPRDWHAKAAECAALIGAAQPQAAALLESFRGFAEETPLGKLQEVYSGFFDLNSICHPYVGYQLFGENYKRSAFLVELKKSLSRRGIRSGRQ